MRLRPRWTTAIAALLVVSAACTRSDGGTDGSFAPSFEETACPSDVASVILADVSCGYLTVLEDRGDPKSSATIRLFVTRIEPSGGSLETDPMFTIGPGLGETPNYPAMAPLAERMDRVTYVLDPRGTAHSEPSLECPEVSDLAERMLGARLSDPSARADLLDAVESCRDRVAESGVDLSAYTLEQGAADIEDLRRALRIPTWNIIAWGSDSRIVLELVRRYPEGLRSVILHGPQLPELDPITEAPGETREAIAQVAAACKAHAACDTAYPNVLQAFARAVDGLEQHPIETNVTDSAGRPIRVLVDGSAFLRATRNMISDAELGLLPRVPATIDAALDGDVSTVARLLADDRQSCTGYLTYCTHGHGFSHGAYYTALCHDLAPYVDRSKLEEANGGEPAWINAYGENPYLDICDVWDVGVADALVHEPVTSDVPILIFRGQFDAYSSRAAIDRAAENLTAVQVVHVPNQSHDIKDLIECYQRVRRTWVDDPTGPADGRCLRAMPPPAFVI